MKTYVTERLRADGAEILFQRGRFASVICFCLTIASMVSGCTALHPVRGVPASYLPEQFIGPSRDNKRTIDLSLLVRTPPDQYRVEAGDVLSIFVPRVLGVETTDVNSVGIAPPINMPNSPEDPPTVGFPIQVRDDNTISLPQIPPLYVGKMTLHEVEQAIFKAYTETHRILNPAEAMVLVSLQRPRVTRVLVVRQEANSSISVPTGAGSINIGSSGRGTARTVTLKAYENDVLHALAHAQGADGLPGLDAENAIYIIRRRPRCTVVPSHGGSHVDPAPAYPQHGLPILPQSSRTRGMTPGGVSPVSGMQSGNPGIQNAYYETVTGQPAGEGVSTDAQWSGIVPVQHSFQSYPEAYSLPMSPRDRVNALSDAQRTANGARPEVIQPLQYQAEPVNPPAYIPAQYQTIQSPTPYQPQQIGGHSMGFNPQLPGVADATVTGEPAPHLAVPPSPGWQHHSLIPNPPPSEPAPQMQEWTGGSVEQGWAAMLQGFDPTIDNPNVIRIPVRLAPGEDPNITEEQITLHDGDIIFIDSRETEVFYTAGLLGGGQYTLPRDYDLGVLEAVSIAEGMSAGGGGGGQSRSLGGVSALNHDVSVSASRLAIIRTLPNGKRVTIEVDLKRAMRYREENIRIQPGDILVLQYTFPEAVSAFTHRYLLEGALFGLAAGMVTSGR